MPIGGEPDPDEAKIKDPFQRLMVRHFRTLNSHLWELRRSADMVSDWIQSVEERERRAREKE